MLILRRSALGICSSSAFNGRTLSISTAVQNLESESHCQEVLVQGSGCSRKAILNRPSALNALTTSMVTQLHQLYQTWENHSDIGFVVMKGAGDGAFCTGGDVVRLYQLANQGKLEECKDYFSKAYQFVYHVGTYLKPHVALLDGLTMGGGAGITVPGTFRVATNKTVFGTPETHIGFHPDAGASFFLSHLPGFL
ncbi:hypothetical protein KI387_008955, partial [Taxus chinensis]